MDWSDDSEKWKTDREHGAWSTEPGARNSEHGVIQLFFLCALHANAIDVNKLLALKHF